MFGIPDTVTIAIIMTVPTLLVYFGSRKKQKAETDGLIGEQWKRLNDAQNLFTDQMEERIKVLTDRISTQDVMIAQQNQTIAQQNQTISAQANRIAEQDRVIREQQALIADLTKQIEEMNGTPVHKAKSK